MKTIEFDYSQATDFVCEKEIEAILPEVAAARKTLTERTGEGNAFLGWLDLPDMPEELISDIEKTAEMIRSEADVLIVIGIGGSYLGAKAAVSALRGTYANEIALLGGQKPAIYFSGCDMSSDHLASLLELIKNKKVFINVISKSGTTTEPAISLRILCNAVKESAKDDAKRRIIATTDAKKGALKTLADKEGWKTFVVPDNVGGRFSVLTPVGLLPIASVGLSIREMIKGAKAAKENAKNDNLRENTACMYAAVRNILYRKGKKTEILANFEQGLHYLGEWWKQLYGESEGKDGKGIYPDSLDFSTDLHSMGQYIQQGERMLMETFIDIEESRNKIEIPHWNEDLDGLGYLEGKTLGYVNRTALKGTSEAHRDGGVPNMKFTVPKMNEFYLGYIFYMFEYACGVSGYMLNVNPFNQPGVEAYKKNMFRLLGKPSAK